MRDDSTYVQSYLLVRGMTGLCEEVSARVHSAQVLEPEEEGLQDRGLEREVLGIGKGDDVEQVHKLYCLSCKLDGHDAD